MTFIGCVLLYTFIYYNHYSCCISSQVVHVYNVLEL